MSSRACERQIHVRALRVAVARGPVPGSHTPFPAQQITTEAQGPAEGRFAEPGLYRYLNIVDLPCFSWLTRMFWRWCACNTTSRLLCRAEWTSMRFLCSFQSPRPLRDLRAESGELRPPAGLERGLLGLGMGLAATLCGKGGLCGWSPLRIQPGQAAHPPENACRYRLKARASKLVKHGVLHYGDALPHWTARALCTARWPTWPIWTRQRHHQCPPQHDLTRQFFCLGRGPGALQSLQENRDRQA